MNTEDKELQGILIKKKKKPDPKSIKIRYKYRRFIITITPMSKNKFHFSVNLEPLLPWTLTAIRESKNGKFIECIPQIKKLINEYISYAETIKQF